MLGLPIFLNSMSLAVEMHDKGPIQLRGPNEKLSDIISIKKQLNQEPGVERFSETRIWSSSGTDGLIGWSLSKYGNLLPVRIS